jgi:cyclic pyranopterin phosphate synthase
MDHKLTHIDKDGAISMVDVSEKKDTHRRTIYEIVVYLSKDTFEQLQNNALPKGDALNTAKVAGILGAKNTPYLIPLCHPLSLSYIDVRFYPDKENFSIRIEAEVHATAKTGGEIEAMVAAHMAAITIYDMCKALQKDIVISNGRLLYKSGGKSGIYLNESQTGRK